MRIIQITDVHLRNDEPFFRAGVALNDYIIDHLKAEKELFLFLDSGDRFHVSKETGRVNAEVIRFFKAVAEMDNCYSVLIMQGNHDVKEETGSALDVVRGLHSKIIVVDDPFLVSRKQGGGVFNVSDGDFFIYLLPHMRLYSVPGYIGIKSYGDDNFHKSYWESQNVAWDAIKGKIKMVSMHGGDETTGKFFMDTDISFIPGIRSNGHIHKDVSPNHLVSASVTRRDETDKKCRIRYIDMDNWGVNDVEIPLFLNYAQIHYGEDIDGYFESGVHVLPKESLIVDIYGHDDKNLVVSEYNEKWAGRQNPRIYVGEVTPIERRGDAISAEEREELGIGSINVKEIFREFCEEKKLSQAIVDDLMARIE